MVDGAVMRAARPKLTVRERWFALGLFGLALCLRLWIVADYEAHHPQAATPVIDEASYDAWARRIAAGDWVGSGVFFQEPLYSYLLGILYWIAGPSLHAAHVAQAVIGAATAVGVLFLAHRLFGGTAGWIAGFGWAVYRPALWFPALLLKENLFALVLVLLALALIRTRESQRPLFAWGVVGLLAGIGALLRGNLLVMIPFIALWPVARARWQGQRIATAVAGSLCVLACAALALLPVALRNRAVGGEFVLTTSGAGTNFYGGNNLDNPNGVATEFAWVRGVPEHEADDWRHEAERRSGRTLTPVEVSDFWRNASLSSMRDHPLKHAMILGRKFLLTLGAYEVPDNHFLEWDARYVAPLRLPWPGFGVVGPLALVGIALVFATRRRANAWQIEFAPAFEVIVLACLYLGTIVLTVTSDRIRLPLVPLLLPFAALTLHAAFLWLRDRSLASNARVGAALAGLALAILLVWTPVIDAKERANDFDERDFNLAAACLRGNGSLAQAEDLASGLSARHTNSVRVDLLLSEIDFQRGRELLEKADPASPGDSRQAAASKLDGALDRLKNARARANPQELFRVHVLAGVIQQYLGQFASAARHYASALEFDPEDTDVLRRRGLCLANAAMQLPAGPERSKGLAQALSILEPLAARSTDAEFARLLAQIRAAQ